MGMFDFLISRDKIKRDEKGGAPLQHWNLLGEASGSFWKEHLNSNEYRVMRKKGTEMPRTSVYDKFYPSKGYFACRACGLALYSWKSKFNSGTGWPSFGEHVKGNVLTEVDYTFGMRRTELHCARCHSHLGHVFAERHTSKFDRLKTFTERQCINGVSLWYVAGALPKDSEFSTTQD